MILTYKPRGGVNRVSEHSLRALYDLYYVNQRAHKALSNLVPRAHDPFGLRQGSRALARTARTDLESANRGLPVQLRSRSL